MRNTPQPLIPNQETRRVRQVLERLCWRLLHPHGAGGVMWKHRLKSVLLGRNIEEGEPLESTEEKIVDAGPLNADNLGTMMWARMKDGMDPGYDTLKNMVMTQGGVGKRVKVDNIARDAQEKLRMVTNDHIKGILVGGGGGEWLSEFFKMAMQVILDEDIKAN